VSEELFNVEAESLVLAAMLRYPDDFHSINDVGLVHTDFVGGENKRIMKAIASVVGEKRNPDFPLVLEEVRLTGHDSTQEYLSGLLNVPCSIAQAHEYARTVKGLSASRSLANAGAKIIEVAREKRSDYDSAFAAADSYLHSAKQVAPADERSSRPADILERIRSAGPSETISVRFSPTLQRITGGLARGHFWVVGGFSSVGKSAFAVNLAMDVIRQKGHVSLMSTEMTSEQYLMRFLSVSSGVSQRSIRDRITLPMDNTEKLERAERGLSSANLDIYDTLWRLEQIRAKAVRNKEQRGLDVLIVDFIQNVHVKGEEFDDARQVALELQRIAKDLSCTVIGFSQVSNEMAKRDADGADRNYYSFKSSGAIRDAADLAIMLRRDRIGQSRTLNVSVVKNRHGELADIDCELDLETGTIVELEYGE
jgi:replicative DNA helicase